MTPDIIRYANCWEDADILLDGLKIQEGSRILSIASAGDNSFSMLTANPESIVAIDMNPVQLYLCELKAAAFKTLDYEPMLAFFGVSSDEKRLHTYELLKQDISAEARLYWDSNPGLIAEGIIHQGKFERYFKTFRKHILPLIHRHKTIVELFEQKPAGAQQQFYDTRWNTWRWRMLFSIFFSKTVMGRLGRRPEYLKQVKVPVAEYIFNRAEAHLCSSGCQDNYFLKHIIAGNFGSKLPHYLRREHFSSIRENTRRIEFKLMKAEEAVSNAMPYHFCNFSNIFEYMPETGFADFGRHLQKHLPAGAALAYWNLLAPRKFSDIMPGAFEYRQNSEALSQQDKGFFYSRFIVDTVS